MAFVQRTHSCGELRSEHAGKTVTLNGWAHRVRDLGGVIFVDLRDRSGIVQVVLDPQQFPAASDLKSETCLSLSGEVRMRDESTRNAKMATGEIEIKTSSYEILSPSRPLPFPISDEEQMKTVGEEIRIKYRYIDLRRPSVMQKMMMRSSVVRRMRSYLDSRDFLEVETPMFTRSTPEGARDYLVPYRLKPGQFYALPQSPQQYKQLLMVGGIERYYQIAKCFRDESQRADRQPEFTQLDLEMSFVTQEDVLNLAEGLLMDVINGVIDEFGLDKEHVKPFRRLTYDESMLLYGCDKPDLRFDLPLFDISAIAAECEFGVFKGAIAGGACVRGVRFPGGSKLSRKEVGELESFCKEFGAKGMASLSYEEGEFKGSIAKFFSPELQARLKEVSGVEDGDLLCFIADTYMAGSNVLYRLRNEIGDRCGLRDPRVLSFCWVVDFPLVEWNEDENRWDAVHHPFTGPKDEDLIYIDSDPGRIRADCYDVVCNGLELASGSIRIHRPDIQAKVFSLLGIDEATQRSRFGHMLDAFSFGPPPHGGIAPGIDRLVMILADTENIREVMAFPKLGGGYDPMMDAPSDVDEAQWVELGLMMRPTPKKEG